ncbi:RNA polymerase sigma-70 factor [Sunxiuqinia indica]|uniref:RNA polymerase sigma-70 factor n=1 Tax=Sunxiuqinia indica TaxID=2692584 RepID=UPI00135B3EB0|nr:RNA polymerase sigma-70 factor [Sunxiuqinia indica]
MENQLNHKLKEGDARSFSELFKQTHPRLIGYCQLFVKNRKDTEDLVQDCFFQLWQNRAKIDFHKSVESLLFVSLRNKCLNYLKEHSRYSFDSLREGMLSNELQYLYQLDFIEKRELSLEEQLVAALKEAIEELPDRKREILIKNKINGMKQKEIALELGISVKTVEKHLHEAKLELKMKLKKQFVALSLILHLLLQ